MKHVHSFGLIYKDHRTTAECSCGEIFNAIDIIKALNKTLYRKKSKKLPEKPTEQQYLSLIKEEIKITSINSYTFEIHPHHGEHFYLHSMVAPEVIKLLLKIIDEQDRKIKWLL